MYQKQYVFRLRDLTIPVALVVTMAVAMGGRRFSFGSLPAKPVRISVDWNRSDNSTATPRLFGINAYKGMAPDSATDPAYRDNLEYMAPGIVRFHNGGVMQDSKMAWEGLLDNSTHTWDRKKVLNALGSLRHLKQKPEIVLNVPGWPDWMDADQDGFLDADQYVAYAALLAELVRIVNIEGKLRVRYWEITNEKDDPYFTAFYQAGGYGPLKDANKPDRWDDIIRLYNRCAIAMKKVDPTIRTGGPAAARSDLHSMHERFVRGTLAHLDFFSVHAYASGSADDSDETIFAKADLVGKYCAEIVALLHRLSPDRKIPVMLGEYNISWTWETRDARMTNNKGAVFDALVMVNAARAGVYSAQAWNEKDGIYGKTDADNKRRPGAECLHLFNTYMVGETVRAQSADSDVAVMAVRRDSRGHRSLLLVNRSETTRTVLPVLHTGGALPSTYLRYQIAEEGLTGVSRKESATGKEEWILPPHSVSVFVF